MTANATLIDASNNAEMSEQRAGKSGFFSRFGQCQTLLCLSCAGISLVTIVLIVHFLDEDCAHNKLCDGPDGMFSGGDHCNGVNVTECDAMRRVCQLFCDNITRADNTDPDELAIKACQCIFGL